MVNAVAAKGGRCECERWCFPSWGLLSFFVWGNGNSSMILEIPATNIEVIVSPSRSASASLLPSFCLDQLELCGVTTPSILDI